jgi:choline dehydrogenase-like flavoprotein
MLFSDTNQLGNHASQSRVVVIGSGAVGLYAAVSLAARGRNVVVIEAGGSNLGSFDAESFSSVGRHHEGIHIGRGRCLGGTTNLWGGQLAEFQPIDFNGRDWLPRSKWPVSYEELAPYFETTYKNLGLPPHVLHDEGVWRGISASQPHMDPEFEVFLTRWLRIPNFARLFETQVRSDPKIAVITGHTAVGFRGIGTRVDSVRVIDKHGQSHWVEGDTFVIAAGTIENSRLLLHAAQDSGWQCPWRQNQNIGRYFQDHLGGRIGPFRPAQKDAFFDMFCAVLYGGMKFQPKIRMRSDVQAGQQILNIQAMFAFDGKASEHLVYLKQFLRAALFSRQLSGARDLLRHGIGAIRYLPPLMWRYVRSHRVFVPGSVGIFLTVQAEQVPSRDSRISIDSRTVDSVGLPRVILDWRLGEHELASIREFALQIRDRLQSAGIGWLEIDDDLLSSNPRFISRLEDTYHHAGGTIMGWSEDDGVVDRNLCVFGTENLYVGGASVFRTNSNANSTFTALSFATRLVDHIVGSASASSDGATLEFQARR